LQQLEERQQILSLIWKQASDEQAQFRPQPTFWSNRCWTKSDSRGYATNDGEWHQQPKVAAIAMPIRHHEQVLGCINVVFLRKALNATEGAKRYVAELRAAIKKIETGLRAREKRGDSPFSADAI
jgi:IclR family mhp operon transcriptional activator